MTRTQRHTTIALMIALCVLVGIAVPLWAAVADKYDYRIPITITNDKTSTIDYPLCVKLNPAGLMDSGFLPNDALDAAVFDVANVEVPGLTRTDTTTTDNCWWVPPPADLLPTQIDTTYLHVGASTGSSDTPTVWPALARVNERLTDAASADWVNNTNWTLYIGTFTLDVIPSTDAYFITSSPFTVGINTSGELYSIITCTAGACQPSSPITTIGPTLTVGTTYNNLIVSLDVGCTSTDGFFVNGVLDTAHSMCGTHSQSTATSIVMLASMTADMETFAFRDGGAIYLAGEGLTTCSAWTTCYGFDPADIGQSQEGTAANGWNWQGTITNEGSAGTATDAIYHLYRDHASVTVDVGAVRVKETLPLALVSSEVGTVLDLASVTTDLDVVLSTTTSDFGIFTGDDEIERLISGAGGNNEGFFLWLVLVPGVLLGGGAVRSFKWGGFGVLMTGVMIIGGIPIGWYAPGVAIIALFLLFGVAGTVALIGRR